MKKKLLVVLGCGALSMGLTACGDKEQTTAENKKVGANAQQAQETSTKKIPLQGMTTGQYLNNYNKIKSNLTKQNINVLPFEFKKTHDNYTLYSTENKKPNESGYTQVTLGLNNDNKIQQMTYTGPIEINNIKAMIEATGIKWSDTLEQMIKSKGKEKDRINIDGLNIYISTREAGIHVFLTTK